MQSQYDLKGLDFVLMFVPIEPAFSLAVQHDLDLFNEAYEKKNCGLAHYLDGYAVHYCQ